MCVFLNGEKLKSEDDEDGDEEQIDKDDKDSEINDSYTNDDLIVYWIQTYEFNDYFILSVQF